jgi:uncharacterized protein (TIGR04255 family)
MNYPHLEHTPIKETIFSVSYEEIVDASCFGKFLNLDLIKERFTDVKPSVDQQFKFQDGGVEISSNENGFHLKSKNEVIQIRKGSFSLHYLNGYIKFTEFLGLLSEYWNEFDKVTNDELTITDFSVRYINVIETDLENQPTHLVQLYPKQATERNVLNFQNSIQFTYSESPEYPVNAVSTKLNEQGVLLDITVKGQNKEKNGIETDLKNLFMPLQEVKNKAFFDSITARALIKYIE